MNIWGLKRAIGALLLLVLREFIHHFVEVYFSTTLFKAQFAVPLFCISMTFIKK
jgi:hypothetical protein